MEKAPTDAMWKAFKKTLEILEPLPPESRERVLRAASILLTGQDVAREEQRG